jgi:molybdopterin-guanine dinucleotide biosynthesis protein A
MGRNKALLQHNGRTLAERTAEAVLQAAGSVSLIGDPEIYGRFGYPVIPDAISGAGPLGGIHAALQATESDWNLVLACDMPAVSPDFLEFLFDEAERARPDIDCLIPESEPGRFEPLCAVYHRRCGPVIGRKLKQGTRKITDAVAELRIHRLPIEDARLFQNLNTPEDWDWYNSGMGIRR